MVTKKIIINTALLFVFFFSTPIYASTSNYPAYTNYSEFTTNSANERVYSGLNILVPLRQEWDKAYIYDIRIKGDDEGYKALNLGLNYRTTTSIFGKEAVIGGYGSVDVVTSKNQNTFFQQTLGADVTFKSKEDFSVYTNYYSAEEGSKTVSDQDRTYANIAVQDSEEKIMSGYDVGVNLHPVPNWPLTLDVNYFLFGNNSFKTVEGHKIDLSYSFELYQLAPGVILDVGGKWVNKSHHDEAAYAAFTLNVPFQSITMDRVESVQETVSWWPHSFVTRTHTRSDHL